MPTTVGIALAGALGALARYEVDGLISERAGGAFPWGTFWINISGALLLGFVFTAVTGRLGVSPFVRATATTGFLGAYTTFSTLTLETASLIQGGSYGLVALNSIGSLAGGMLAVYVGIFAGRAVA